MKRTALLFLLILGVSLGIAVGNTQKTKSPTALAQTAAKGKKPTISKAEEDDIREAVFRYQFLHNASSGQQSVSTYYLSFGNGKEPSDEFLNRFAGHKPSVKKESQADKSNGVIKDGFIFYTGKITWKGKNHVTVDGGYYEAPLSASGNIYTVIRKNGKWVVTKDAMRWIS